MVSRSVMLGFPRKCVSDPVISDLVKGCGIEVNILRARIDPSEEGRMLARLRGPEEVIENGLSMLRERGVEISYPESSFIWQEARCVHCGACAGICPSGAFTICPETFMVGFDMSGCILCDLCIEVCYYGAIQSVEDYIGGCRK
ncbi:MAG: 4Fe-4S binding protein [Candidatus Fermentibacteraceae bacterium]|nr:4Fe-4S binding protein [Candidatus Fermentibacteraceae bacterium]MBN2608226.1 4Fe-4S binding protein [Candidatus Fermentibacteraceae bacterium]